MHYFSDGVEKNDLLGLSAAGPCKMKEVTFIGSVLILQIHRIWNVRAEGILGFLESVPPPNPLPQDHREGYRDIEGLVSALLFTPFVRLPLTFIWFKPL